MASRAYQAELEAACPEGWKIVPLTDAVLFQEGPGILAKDFHDSGVPLIRLKGVEGDFVTLDGCNYLEPEKVAQRWSHFRLKRGDLVISTSASFGRVSEVTEEAEGAIPYTGLIRFRPKSKDVDARFLRAFLGSSAFMRQVEAMASGSVIRHFGPMHLKQMALPLPPIDEQRSIGEMATLFAERLRNLRQTNATLEAIAQALFKSWFVDFDGVLPEDMQESELGLIPKGWRAFRLGEIATLGKGTVNPAAEPQTMFQHYSLPAFDAGQMPISEVGEAIKSNKTPVPSGAILVSKLNPHIPRIWFVGEAGKNAVCSTEFLVWMPKPGIGSAFAYFVATSQEFNARMRQLVTGTSNSHQRVRPEQLTQTHAVVASESAIAAFDQVAAPLLRRVERSRQQVSTLAALRDTLLPRLISGQLRVRGVECPAEETA